MNFTEWLREKLQSRDWSQNELARRAGLTSAALSMIMSKQRGAGPDVCRGLARALHLPPEEVFRRAGLLPPLPADTDEMQYTQLRDTLKYLTCHDRDQVMEYARMLYRLDREKEEVTP